LIRSPGSLDHCRSEHDFRSVTAFFDNWRYNFVGANLLVYKLRRLGFSPIEVSAAAILGLGPDLELHSAHAAVEVPAQDAHIHRVGMDHLAHIEDVRVRQSLQHGARDEATGGSTVSAAVRCVFGAD
jgi:hypothetical protein